MKNNFILILFIVFFSGCTAIPISDITPVLNDAGKCNSKKSLTATNVDNFVYLLPASVQEKTVNNLNAVKGKTVNNFTDYSSRISSAKEKLPDKLKDNSVVNAIFSLMIKTSAKSQLEVAYKSGLFDKKDDKGNLIPLIDSDNKTVISYDAEKAKIDSYYVPTYLSHSELKDFANLFTSEYKLSTSSNKTTNKGDEFIKYFVAYYEGKFVDRLGRKIQKPQLFSGQTLPISINANDTDIANAITVFLEYVIDLTDPTPVIGNTIIPDETTEYYGLTKDKPTVLINPNAPYRKIEDKGTCGINQETVHLLQDVANFASDEAATVSGLVTQSSGGIGVSLGFFGKISIGDNQTLGTIVKSAASRLALRASYASEYWILDSIVHKDNFTAMDYITN